VIVRCVIPSDSAAWLSMRVALWPEGTAESHGREIERFFAGQLHMPLAVLVAVGDNGRLVGFAELSIRAYAENCVTDRVAYLEGWYVAPGMRRRGIGRALVGSAEDWARALGFTETVQIRCFRKDLGRTS